MDLNLYLFIFDHFYDLLNVVESCRLIIINFLVCTLTKSLKVISRHCITVANDFVITAVDLDFGTNSEYVGGGARDLFVAGGDGDLFVVVGDDRNDSNLLFL